MQKAIFRGAHDIASEIRQTTKIDIEILLNVLKSCCLIIYHSQEIYETLRKIRCAKVKSAYDTWAIFPETSSFLITTI